MGNVGTSFVSGAAGGLGRAFARHLAKSGYKLLLTDRDEDQLTLFANQLRLDGVQVQHIIADLAKPGDLQRVVEALTAVDDLDVLINNAGFGLVCKFQNVDLQTVIDMVQVHIVANLTITRTVLPRMITRAQGSIINVASAGAFLRFPRDAAYIASKAHIVAFTECLALDLVSTGVRVQALCPAWITTDFTQGTELVKVGYKSPIPKWFHISPETVVASSLRALTSAGPVTHIPTVKARVAIACIGSTLGRWLLAQMRKLGMGQKPMRGD